MPQNPKKHYSTAVYDFTVDGGAHAATNHIALADSATFPDRCLCYMTLLCIRQKQRRSRIIFNITVSF